jgi:hypothetical protein
VEVKEYDPTMYDVDDIKEYIFHDFVLKAASDYTNRRIEKYRDSEDGL